MDEKEVICSNFKRLEAEIKEQNRTKEKALFDSGTTYSIIIRRLAEQRVLPSAFSGLCVTCVVDVQGM